MKYRIVYTAAIAATGAYAQQQYPGSSSSSPVNPAYTPPASSSPAVSPSASYVTVTYDDCPSQSIESLITMTQGVTVTYCPECDHDTPTSKPGPSHTTVYTTVYQSLCSTGLVPVTYTVTEECEEPTPTWASTKGDHVPQGFTVTVKECHVCDKTPVPVTITEPCKDGCGKKTPAPPAATGPSGGKVSQIPDGQVQAPGKLVDSDFECHIITIHRPIRIRRQGQPDPRRPGPGTRPFRRCLQPWWLGQLRLQPACIRW